MLYTSSKVPGKGIGLVATTLLLEGTLILAETQDQSGIYLSHSKINHSCRPNANVVRSPSNMQLEVRAMKNIVNGEEITISYHGREHENSSYIRRMGYLYNHFGFICKCVICKADPETIGIDDANRTMVSEKFNAIPSLAAVNPARALKQCKELVILCTELGKYPELAKVYYEAFRICIRYGDAARATVFSRLVVEQTQTIEGPELAHKMAEHLNEYRACGHLRSGGIREEGTKRYDFWLWGGAESSGCCFGC